MKKKTLLSSAAFATAMAAASFAHSGEMKSPIEAVTLSTGGLAEIRRSTSLNGSGDIRIEVPLEQVNDILKSLVVFDPKGQVKDISLAGPSPLKETFKNLPFTPDDLESMPRLLSALKGTGVKIEGAKQGEGTILGVESEPLENGKTATFLNIVGADGVIKRFEIDGDTSVLFTDPEVAKKVANAVAVVGTNATDTARNISVKIDGEGKRDVAFSYVVAAPIWKTSYRVVVEAEGKARLQAWAVLENATGEDWNGVNITLNSSSPVTLTQKLHDRYWKQRTELPITVDNVGLPQADTGDLGGEAMARSAAKAAPQVMGMMENMTADIAMPMAAEAPAPEAGIAYAQSAKASEGDISASFSLEGRFDIKNGDTVSVPIIDSEVSAELVSLYRPDSGNNHPISAVSMDNGTGVSLPGGILTVYDQQGKYVGDSSLLGLPNGETRMSSFALDKKVNVETRNDSDAKTVEITVLDGVLTTKNVNKETTTYVVHGANDGERTIIIEHPKRDGWKFTSEDLDGESSTDYRLKVHLKKGETREVKATYQYDGAESYQLTDLDDAQLMQWSSSSLDPVIQDKLKELARAKRDEMQTRRELDSMQETIASLQQSQERTRQNIQVMPAGSDQQKQYLAKLTEIETEIEGAEAKQSELRNALDKFAGRVGDIIRTF